MKITYLDYAQAKAVCKDYQCLIGNLFNKENEAEGVIRQVVIAPHSRILQWKFIRLLLQGDDPETVIAICPDARYDVLLLPDRQDYKTVNVRSKSVRSYLREQNIAFNSLD